MARRLLEVSKTPTLYKGMHTALENSPVPAADDILLEHDVQRLGRELHSRIKGKSPGIFQ
jgi:hypothetical protein